MARMRSAGFEGLREELGGAGFHGFDGGRDVAVAGEEDDGRVGGAGELALKLKAGHAGKIEVEDEAGGGCRDGL